MALFRDTHPGNVVLFLVVSAALYAGVLFTPHYLMKLDLAEAVSSVHPYASRRSDEELVRLIESRTTEFGTHTELDEYGVEQVVKGLGLTHKNVSISRDGVTNEVRIEVRYVQPVRLVPTRYVYPLELVVAHEGVPTGGPAL